MDVLGKGVLEGHSTGWPAQLMLSLEHLCCGGAGLVSIVEAPLVLAVGSGNLRQGTMSGFEMSHIYILYIYIYTIYYLCSSRYRSMAI